MDTVFTLSWSLLLGLLTLNVSGQTFFQSNPLLTGQYRHEITYPTQFGRIQQHTTYLNHPISRHAGFRLKTSHPLPPILPNSYGNVFQPAGNMFVKPAPTAASLFTPNTVQQPAESPGQLENYRKALEEEVREADKAANDISISTTLSQIDEADLDVGTPKSYVDVMRVEGAKEYNYGYFV